jgi:hypothetical protein
MKFQITQDWIDGYPARRKKRRMHFLSSIFTLIVIGLYVDSVSFWVVSALFIIYDIYNLLIEPPVDKMNALLKALAIEVKDDGLYQHSLQIGATGQLQQDAFYSVTPWQDLQLKSFTEKNEHVSKIVLKDMSQPFGARAIKITNYENMADMLAQIKTQLAA